MTPPLPILVVDDVPEIGEILEFAFASIGPGRVELTVLTDASVALERARTQAFHLIISDYRMPRVDGLTILAEARRLNPRGYRVLMTGYNEIPATYAEARAADVDAYLHKPLHTRDLITLARAFVDEDRERLRAWRDEAREVDATTARDAPS